MLPTVELTHVNTSRPTATEVGTEERDERVDRGDQGGGRAYQTTVGTTALTDMGGTAWGGQCRKARSN